MKFKPLPIGIDDFEKMIEKGYYYVDKTLLIKELLDMGGEVNLFTRPRRFGKTLNMSMLQCFFEKDRCNSERLFENLAIMDAGEEYTKHMSEYPVISVSLKSMKQANYELSYEQMKKIIAEEYRRHDIVLESDRLSEAEKKRYQEICDVRGTEADYLDALKFLSLCLMKYYNRKTIMLIDEYDVPLENSYFCGYYDKMIPSIRSLFESALKTNENLEFSVITGCLRISRESIFTGLNNLDIISILNEYYSEHFGFTEAEIKEMLEFYGCSDAFQVMRTWYDGYQFGQTEVYNPWSAVNYVKALWKNNEAIPNPYWANTSSNDIIRTLVEEADISVRKEIEDLIQGKNIEKPIHEDITYEDIYKSQNNLWNFLFFTGYLKQAGKHLEGGTQYITMAIPNEEVRYIYKNTILGWFDEKVKNKDLSRLYEALENGDTEVMAQELSAELQETISFYDYAESYYHGFLAGLLKRTKKYQVISNRESGLGRPDIVLKTPSVRGRAIIIEIKVAKEFTKLDEKCVEALTQIEDRGYEEGLQKEGYTDILKYGVCFYRKECSVLNK